MTAIAEILKHIAKWLISFVLEDYSISWVYALGECPTAVLLPASLTVARMCDKARALIAASEDMEFRHALSFDDPALEAFVLSERGEPVAVAHFAAGDAYAGAVTWPLAAGEVALVNLVTREDRRGRGLGPLLINAADTRLLAARFTRAIAFIWWSNRASVRAFRKAGWRRTGLSVRLQPRRLRPLVVHKAFGRAPG